MRYELEKITIDDQGYAASGEYWGTPSNLWKLFDNDGDGFSRYFRADSPGAALEYAKYHFEARQDQILVTIPGWCDNDFTI